MSDKLLFKKLQSKISQGEDIRNDLFQFDGYDGWFIRSKVIPAIEKLMEKRRLFPGQISHLSKLLLGLKRLPCPTPGLSIELRVQSPSVRSTAKLNQEELLLKTEYYYDHPSLAPEPGWYEGSFLFGSIQERDCSYLFVQQLEWGSVFSELIESGEIIFCDQTEDTLLDWDHDDGKLFWEWINDRTIEQ